MLSPIPRPRLLQTIDDASHHVAVIACAGAGKSELALQLGDEPGTTLFRPVLDDRPDSETLTSRLVIDAAPLSIRDEELADVLRMASRTSTVVLLARHLGPRTVAVVDALMMRRLGTRDLLFDEAELGALVEAADFGAATTIPILTDFAGGWPRVVATALNETADISGGEDVLRQRVGAQLDRVLTQAAQGLGDESQAALQSLVLLGRVDLAVVEALGHPTLLDDLLAAGLPLLDRGDGWWSLLAPVARQVLQRAKKVSRVPPAAFEALAARGRPMEAIQAAIASGQVETAVELFADLQVDQVANAGEQLDAIDALLGSQIDEMARAALPRAWRHTSQGNINRAIEVLEIGLTAAERDEDAPLSEELRAELGFCHYFADTERAVELVGGPDDPLFTGETARARQLEIRGGLLALTMEPDALERAAVMLRSSADLWIASGQVVSARDALQTLAVEVIWRRGRYVEAVAVLDHAGRLSDRPMHDAQTAMYRAMVLAHAGDPATEESIEQATRLSESTGIAYFAAAAGITKALLASHAGDSLAAQTHVDVAFAGYPDLLEEADGALVLADLVDIYARLGDADQAFARLEMLEAHEYSERADLLMARVAAHCKVGDSAAALDAIAEFESSGLMVPYGQWRLEHARSVALARSGQHDEAERAMARARSLAANDNERMPPDLRVGDVAETAQPGYAIAVMGDFSVSNQGDLVTPPLGHQRTVVKLLVLAGGQVSVDQAIDALWPEASLDVGRRRLRNVLTRVKASCGELIDREGDTLRLGSTVESDLQRWRQRIENLDLANAAHGDLDAMIHGVPNELLTEDRYEEWLQGNQRRYQLDLLRLLDRRVEIAIAADDVDTAISMISRALEIVPGAVDRVDAAVQLLRKHGRASAASDFERTWLAADSV